MKSNFTNQNDWRIQQLGNKKLTLTIIEKILDEISIIEDASNVKIQILTPGLSGYHVLLVIYTRAGIEYNFLLKIGLFEDINEINDEIKKQNEANSALSISRFDNSTFIDCGYIKHFVYENNHWLFFVFSFAKDKDTFKDFFSRGILKSDFNLNSASQIIKNSIDKYETGKWHRELVETNIWTGSENYNPMTQKKYYYNYLENIHDILSRRPDLAKELGISNENIGNLCAFLQNNRYRTFMIDPKLEKTPIGQVHGDLNSGNILINKKDGKDPVFIDFIQMPDNKKRHILYDFGKLSIDFERYIMPAKVFDDRLIDKLKLWIDIHNDWIQNKDIEKYEKENNIIYRLYRLLSTVRECANGILEKNNIDNKDRQFLFIRLHYLLRMINHPHLEDFRKLFAIKASIDLLDFLIENPRTEPLSNYNNNGLFFDCTKDEFINHLVLSNRISIIGITNETLSECIKKAYKIRKSKNLGEWEELKVLFASRQLLEDLVKKNSIDSSDNIESRWHQGIGSVRTLLDNSVLKCANITEVRRTDTVLPFIGQMYDGHHIRVAYLLPDFNLRKSCYSNYSIKNPPCKQLHSNHLSNNNLEDQRLCKKQNSSIPNCDSCEWKDRAVCNYIQQVFTKILNESTPMFTANVYGIIDGNKKFRFRGLIPQYKWRDFKTADGRAPTFLFVFILLFNEDKVLLQYRNPENSSGDINEYAVIPGKVNDEDFFDSEPEKEYRDLVYKLQTVDNQKKTFAEYHKKLINNFIKKINESITDNFELGKEIPDNILNKTFIKAASRTIYEKLGISIQAEKLKGYDKMFIVEKNESEKMFNLYIKLFSLDITIHELKDIELNRPFANLKKFSIKELDEKWKNGKLTQFLSKNFEEISKYVNKTIN